VKLAHGVGWLNGFDEGEVFRGELAILADFSLDDRENHRLVGGRLDGFHVREIFRRELAVMAHLALDPGLGGTSIPAGDHRLDVRGDGVAGGGEVDVDDEEGQDHEGADGMEEGDPFQAEQIFQRSTPQAAQSA
jgi:hypothetical protein